MAKPEYHGKDFFQRKEFRGLLLADYQEAIGEKAFACVDQLNTNTVSQFSNLKSFREAIGKKKLLEKFYREGGLSSKASMRGGSVTSRGVRGNSLLTANSTLKSAKHSDAGIFNSSRISNPKKFANLTDSQQLALQ